MAKKSDYGDAFRTRMTATTRVFSGIFYPSSFRCGVVCSSRVITIIIIQKQKKQHHHNNNNNKHINNDDH